MKRPILPSAEQREQLSKLLAQAFIEIRLLCWGGHAQQAADLADVFHNLPREMYGWGSFNWDRLRAQIVDYERKYEGRLGYDYASQLDRIHSTV